MCGINGIISFAPESESHHDTVERMNRALAHRGPDDSGIFTADRIGLGHRRLSIIDLSMAGHQPMVSPDGRFVLVYNGEIYNFRELRSNLDYPFRSHTDTEVLLASWVAWGAECIDHLIGMFAFAVWDREKSELHLVRDRLGIKPLYYYQDQNRFVFSSEVRAVLASGFAPRTLNASSVVDYLRYQCVHQPDTIVSGVRLLPPATHMCVSRGEAKIRHYWSSSAADVDRQIDVKTARKRILDALLVAVERRLVADVPFGAFLSGGIDSSAIVALMSRVTDKVSTFSISFAEEQFSEARYARMVAHRYRTDHHEIQLAPEDFLDLLPAALDGMDHPSGDGPNTYVVSKATKDAGITMALSGLGGDELFAGYPIFSQSVRIQGLSRVNLVPRILRNTAGKLLQVMRPGIASMKIAEILRKPQISPLTAYPLYRQVLLDSQILKLLDTQQLPSNRVDQIVADLSQTEGFKALPLLSQVSVIEMATYMQHVLLRDTDQMSMAHALEVRVPFLDHELVELVLGLPDALKTSHSHTPKQLLVESLGDLLPREIVNRPKMGFTLPYGHWMKHELRGFCGERIRLLAQRTQFNHSAVMALWNNFLEGESRVSWSRIWMLVVLEHWMEKNGVS